MIVMMVVSTNSNRIIIFSVLELPFVGLVPPFVPATDTVDTYRPPYQLYPERRAHTSVKPYKLSPRLFQSQMKS
jgi:hypothetical protein